ncbi:MAG: S9 family peptidase, partial [Gammaproteobacteria bacterium]|nr:S9 family peptidase [Gammaproteobacteria bacterium]
FASPSLEGPSIQGLTISPDGSRIGYLQGKDDDRERLDLWAYEVASGQRRMLVDSLVLVPEEVLSDEEKARRERQRIGGLRGIVEYRWSDDGRALLIPLGGDLYSYDLSAAPNEAVRRLTETPQFETDARLSPGGRYASFIRDQNLFVLEIATGRERQLTHDGGGTIKNGMAEFVAQEEMDRDTGYWWSEDESRIAFIRVHEDPVDIARRYEIYADDVQVVEQRYPYAGAANVRVELGMVEVGDGAIRWFDLGSETDFYLPRVQWLPDSRRLSYQWQSRDQKVLELRVVNTDSGTRETVLTERADTWINLHSDLRFLGDGERFVWASERSGQKHLYLHSLDGREPSALTAGDWSVDALEGVDDERIYFTAAAPNPTEKHLYSQALNTAEPRTPSRITEEPGWHQVTMNDAATLFLDRFSNQSRPPRITLHDPAGRRIVTMLDNPLDATHPYWPYSQRHSVPEFGTLTAADGQTLHYRLTKPYDFDPERQYPVFVFVYGGPHAQTVVNQWGRPFEQYMQQRGFVVFSLDNRGMGRRGHVFEAPLYRHMGSVEIKDQLAGARYLQSLGYVDPDRIGVFGWSYGGYMTLMALLQAPDIYAAGVAVAPVTDWRLYDTHYTERYLGHPDAADAGYEPSSVLPWVERLEGELPPLLVMHGMADDNVLFTHSTQLFEALQNRGLLFDAMPYPGGKHSLSGAGTQTHVYTTIAAFFERHLNPDAH